MKKSKKKGKTEKVIVVCLLPPVLSSLISASQPPGNPWKHRPSVLDEDIYVVVIEKIIERDFFLDIPKLHDRLNWLEAVYSGDPILICDAQLKILEQHAAASTDKTLSTIPDITTTDNRSRTPGSTFLPALPRRPRPPLCHRLRHRPPLPWPHRWPLGALPRWELPLWQYPHYPRWPPVPHPPQPLPQCPQQIHPVLFFNFSPCLTPPSFTRAPPPLRP